MFEVVLVLLLGTFGMGVICYGIRLPLEKQFWPIFWGASALTVIAVINRHWTFVALEVVLFIGLFLGELKGRQRLKFFVPLASGVVALIVLYYFGQLNTLDSWIGAAGLFVLALGFAVKHPMIYFLGSVLLLVYSVFGIIAGVWIAGFWAVLNAVFAVLALKLLFAKPAKSAAQSGA